MVLSGAVRVFYVAEVEPVDEPYWLDANPNELEVEDFCPLGPTECDLCGDCLPPGEGTHNWAGTDMHVCDHHEYALDALSGRDLTFRRVSMDGWCAGSLPMPDTVGIHQTLGALGLASIGVITGARLSSGASSARWLQGFVIFSHTSATSAGVSGEAPVARWRTSAARAARQARHGSGVPIASALAAAGLARALTIRKVRTNRTSGWRGRSAGDGDVRRHERTKGRQLIAQNRVHRTLCTRPKRARYTPRGKASNVTALQLLMEGDSEFALRPSNNSDLHDLCNAVDDAIADGINDGTASGERSAMNKYYIPYAKSLGTAVWRTTAAAANPLREGAFACGFALRVWKLMKARTKADKLARVDSVRSVIGHVRRAHSRKGYSFASTSMMAHVMKSLSRRRLLAVGVAIIRRAEPFTTQEAVATKTITPGTKVGLRVYQPNTLFWAGWRLVDTYSDQTGARKAEVVGDGKLGFHHNDVQFSLDGATYTDPSPSDLARIVAGDFRTVYVTVAVGPSKADQDGSKFGQHLVSLLYNRANPMSFAVALVDYLIMFPVRGGSQGDYAAFHYRRQDAMDGESN